MRIPRDKSRRLLGFARTMRHQPTDAERKLWRILRSGRLYDYKFRRQHPVAGYILDFYCVATRLAVELDGGQHDEDSAREYDRRRTSQLMELGVRVIRFWDHHVLTKPEIIAAEILRLCDNREALAEPVGAHAIGPSPQPSPGVPGEGAENARPLV